jgi:GT2 family glycosyltransferase
MSAACAVSFVISTHNRREVVLDTLRRIYECGQDPRAFEVLLIDNDSHDGTTQAVVSEFRDVRMIPLMSNLGPCARNIGIERARGKYIVFLDDDSYPQPGSIEEMVGRFEDDPALGAAVFTVTLPNGDQECCAYPGVFIGCGTGFRADALKQVGGLPEDFFMAAEEYDLSLRLMNAGWTIRRFDDLHVTHLKSPSSRAPWRLMRLDVRNNFLVATRHLPPPWDRRFAMDWLLRYYRIASTQGQRTAFAAGLIQGMFRAMRPSHRQPVSAETFEQFTLMEEIQRRIAEVQQELNLRKVLFIDYGKNILPYWLAARKCGIQVVAIADHRLALSGKYRGAPIVDDALARTMDFDAAIVSNSSTVHAQLRVQAWRELDRRPVIDLLDSSESARSNKRATELAA